MFDIYVVYMIFVNINVRKPQQNYKLLSTIIVSAVLISNVALITFLFYKWRLVEQNRINALSGKMNFIDL